MFCHTLTWISYECTCVPSSWTPLQSPHPHPSGLSQSTSFECPASCIKLALWSSVLHMIIYMFQCYSLKSSHPRFLPHRPKVCSLYLCLFCCLAYRVVVVAAAAKSLQSCLTLCDPTDGSPPGSPIPGILQTRTLEWVAISFSKARKWKVKVKSLNSVWLLATPWTAAYQAPLSMGFSRQKSTGVGCHCLLWGLLLPSLS